MQTISEIKVPINPITRKTLDMFVERVKEHEKNNLSKIVLFGSVARGEANKDSDIDVLVIMKNFPREKRHEISDISADIKWDMNFDENAYLQVIPISEAEANGIYFRELMVNVKREGVILYDSK